jgi:hypothetical protein
MNTPAPWKTLQVSHNVFQITAASQTENYSETQVALAVIRAWDGEPPMEQVEANALLMAAAPNLFNAAILALEELVKTNQDSSAFARMALRDALAKATGQE